MRHILSFKTCGINPRSALSGLKPAASFIITAAVVFASISCDAPGSRQTQWQEPPPVPVEESDQESPANATNPARDQQGNPRLDRVP